MPHDGTIWQTWTLDPVRLFPDPLLPSPVLMKHYLCLCWHCHYIISSLHQLILNQLIYRHSFDHRDVLRCHRKVASLDATRTTFLADALNRHLIQLELFAFLFWLPFLFISGPTSTEPKKKSVWIVFGQWMHVVTPAATEIIGQKTIWAPLLQFHSSAARWNWQTDMKSSVFFFFSSSFSSLSFCSLLLVMFPEEATAALRARWSSRVARGGGGALRNGRSNVYEILIVYNNS